MRLISTVLTNLTSASHVPPGQVRCILADDFTGEIERWMSPTYRREEGAFTTSREGGIVVGKNLDQSAHGSDVVIVFDASFWAPCVSQEAPSTLAPGVSPRRRGPR